METPLERLELLVGEAAIQRLKQACVLIVGIGGVGGYAAEALGRMSERVVALALPIR